MNSVQLSWIILLINTKFWILELDYLISCVGERDSLHQHAGSAEQASGDEDETSDSRSTQARARGQ